MTNAHLVKFIIIETTINIVNYAIYINQTTKQRYANLTVVVSGACTCCASYYSFFRLT